MPYTDQMTNFTFASPSKLPSNSTYRKYNKSNSNKLFLICWKRKRILKSEWQGRVDAENKENEIKQERSKEKENEQNRFLKGTKLKR